MKLVETGAAYRSTEIQECVTHHPTKKSKALLWLEPPQWLLGIILSAIITEIFRPVWSEYTVWLPIALWSTLLTLYHFLATLGRLVPIPHIAILTASLSYVIAPLLSLYYPPANKSYIIADPSTYFAFACPALAAIVIGWFLPLTSVRYDLAPPMRGAYLKCGVPKILDWIFVVGSIGTLVRFNVELPPAFDFPIVILGYTTFISLGGWIATRVRRRIPHLVVAMAIQLYAGIKSSMFHEFLLIAVCLFTLWIATGAVSRIQAGLMLVLGALLLIPLQEAKNSLRAGYLSDDAKYVSVFGETHEVNAINRPILFGEKLFETFMNLASGKLSSSRIGDDMVRFNQGWLIARVLRYVPANEPFARGETIKNALIASILPRIVYDSKDAVGGRERLRRFAGITLIGSTSMNIGYAGEMYANFGPIVGIVACGIYAYLLSLIFYKICVRAVIHPLLFGFVPFICVRMIIAESDLTDIFNYLAKASLAASLLFAFTRSKWEIQSHTLIETSEAEVSSVGAIH